MPDRIIAIGDIHGCSLALEAVLKLVEPRPSDLFITLGDYVDRGPDSKGVIDQLLALSAEHQLVPLLGNHEVMMLQSLASRGEMRFWLHCGGHETLDSYGGATEIPFSHLEFLEGCRRYHETAEHFFVHANYVPHLPLEKQPDMALFWEHISLAPKAHMSGKSAVVGHTPQLSGEILDLGHVRCIDTFCFGSGYLTALEVQTGQIWQADKMGRSREM